MILCSHWWQKTSYAAIVPTPIIFLIKWHPSKLMGCNHHHKYSVTRPTAHSGVFNPKSMGCKEWQARGAQFSISLTASRRKAGKRIQKVCLRFGILGFCLLNSSVRPQRGETFIRRWWDTQSILLTVCFRHPSTLSPCEIILIKVCRSLTTDLLGGG